MHGSSLYVCVSVYRCICMDQVYMYCVSVYRCICMDQVYMLCECL